MPDSEARWPMEKVMVYKSFYCNLTLGDNSTVPTVKLQSKPVPRDSHRICFQSTVDQLAFSTLSFGDCIPVHATQPDLSANLFTGTNSRVAT